MVGSESRQIVLRALEARWVRESGLRESQDGNVHMLYNAESLSQATLVGVTRT